MRGIKFRAWDGERIINDWFKAVYKPPSTFDGLNFPACYSPVLNNSMPLEIMQYTGLQDKNGKDIYEGDVIKWKSEHNPANGDHVDAVEFASGYWNLSPWVHELYATVDREIIGNIYENPELINEQQ